MKKTILLSCLLFLIAATAVAGERPLFRADVEWLFELAAGQQTCILFLGNNITPFPKAGWRFHSCSLCRTKNLYFCRNRYDNRFVTLDNARASLPELRESGLAVSLDDRELCGTCVPDLSPESRRSYWLFRIGDEFRRIPVKKHDERILLAFLDRKPLFWVGSCWIALSLRLSRLRELLGGETNQREKQMQNPDFLEIFEKIW